MNRDYGQVTAVVGFGSAADSGFVLIEIDAASHTDSDGNVASSFLPGEDVFILIHHGADVDEIRAVDSATGTIELLGTVTRENSVELAFAPDIAELELPHIPVGLVSFDCYGTKAIIEANGSRTVTTTDKPIVVDVTYKYEANRYRYRLPADITITGEDEFPVDFYIETMEGI